MSASIPPHVLGAIRPLRRIAPGHWKSRDGHWTFVRERLFRSWGPRWFVYYDDDEYPDPAPALSLHEAAARAEQATTNDYLQDQANG